MEVIRRFYEQTQREEKSARQMILTALKNRKDLFFYRKKEKLLHSILSTAHQQNQKILSLEKENQKLLGICFFEQHQRFRLIEKYAELFLSLSKEGYKEDYQEFIEQIFLIARDQNMMIEKKLSISAIEKGALDLKITEFSFSKMVNQACLLHEGLARSKNATLHFSLTPHQEKIRSDADLTLFLVSLLMEQMLRLAKEGADIFIHLFFKEGHFVLQINDENPAESREPYHRLIEGQGKDFTPALIKKLAAKTEARLELMWEDRKKAGIILELPLRITV